jgi:2-oxoglutarate ferredoxin oxidoreductase subunit delta
VPQILIDRERCKGCLQCVQACPRGVLALGKAFNTKGYAVAEVVAPRRCLGCRLCCIACPDVAVEMRVTGTLYHYFAY